MRKSVFKFALLLAAFTACLSQAATARATEVTLTSGSVVMNCPAPGFGRASIDLAGPDFSLHFFYTAQPDPNCAGAQQLLQPARFDAVAFATFQGITTQEMDGFLSFDEASLSGFVEGKDLLTRQSLFTVNFTGTGVGSVSSTRSTFQVVPEPATLILLGTGTALFGGARRVRNRRGARQSPKISAREA
jgi:hypothetical protein